MPAGDGGEGSATPESLWYVTVRRALSCLAQLYRCVPRGVFEGLAQEILTEASQSVSRASALLAKDKRSDLDGLLFSISQLLTLREQIAPFDSQFAISRRELDFTQTREAMRSLLGRGGGKGIVELLQSGAPSLVRSHRDAKAALDSELRTHCESFIRRGTDAAAKPLVELLATTTLPPAAAKSGGSSLPASRKLQPAAVAAAVAKAEAGVSGELRAACLLMARYLPERATQGILFGPIRASVLDALGQLETLINAEELSMPQKVKVAAEEEAAAAEEESWSARLSRLAEQVNALADGGPTL